MYGLWIPSLTPPTPPTDLAYLIFENLFEKKNALSKSNLNEI